MSQTADNSPNVLYLCDGKEESCSKSMCYKNGGPCRYTSKIEHAANFSVDYLNHFWETEELIQWMKEIE